MSNFTVQLTPPVVHRASEGSLDTSVSGGVSKQRTGYFDVWSSTNKKVEVVHDGITFNDTMQTLIDLDDLV